ncbi:hypothetical protein OBV_07310 [Oscillibacter valericigenes Sjm18-20]|nr:hypothetical protein OBV_07310 [Oscillibacter valericigenes Sjm18-20]
MKIKGLERIRFLTPGLAAVVTLGMEALVGAITYLAGGTQFALTHLMYIPIILAAYYLNLWGAISSAVIGGLILGPWMPMNVNGNVAQTNPDFIFRTCIFMLVGMIAGLLFQPIKTNTSEQLHISFMEARTGLSNLNTLRYEISALTHEKKKFSMLAFRIANLFDINAYVDYSIGEKSFLYVAEKLENVFGKQNVFMASMDTYMILLPNTLLEYANAMAIKAEDILAAPVTMDGLVVRLEVQCAALHSPSHGTDTDELLRKLKIALDRNNQEHSQTPVVFNDEMIRQNREKFETLTALYAAIQKNEFFMVYQPVIHVASRTIRGVEGLLRWNHTNIHMGPGEFINIAEKAGFINEITKWVIQHSVQQIRIWQDAGIRTKIAVNVSSKDLNDDSVISYAQECIKTNGIDPQLLGFELTERVITENEAKVRTLLNRMRAMGVNISIDDFGTGYNSLIQLVTLPIACLKIDKFFIDHIEYENNQAVIRETIRLAHSLKMEVIAEGVETERQLHLLEKMDCDNIQGYYFSKPLSAKEYIEFATAYQQNSKSGEIK